MIHSQSIPASAAVALLFVSASAWAGAPHAPLPPPGDNARVLQVGGEHEQSWNSENQNRTEPRGGEWHKGK
jgi:hypothetical protein